MSNHPGGAGYPENVVGFTRTRQRRAEVCGKAALEKHFSRPADTYRITRLAGGKLLLVPHEKGGQVIEEQVERYQPHLEDDGSADVDGNPRGLAP